MTRVLMLLVPVAAVLLLIGLARRMSCPVVLDDYSDLRVESQRAPREKNMRVLFEETADLLPAHAWSSNWSRVSSDVLFSGVWDDARGAAILSDSAAARAHFRRELPRYENCVFAANGDAEGSWVTTIGGCLNAAWALEFNFALRAGDRTFCNQNLGEWLRLADLALREESGCEDLLALFLANNALWRCERLVHDHNCPDAWLAEWAFRMPQPEPLRAAAVRALKTEFGYYSAKVDDGTLFREYLDDGSGAPPTSAGGLVSLLLRHTYSARYMKEGLASSYREAIGVALTNRVPTVYLDETCRISEELFQVCRPNSGSAWVLDCMDLGRQTVTGLKRVESAVGCLRVIIACERYRRATGAYPETLQALVPTFLERVPLDPYLGTPLRYARDREIVWAAGENLKDDGGSIVAEKTGRDGLYRVSRTQYALDMVYPVSSNAFAKAVESARGARERMTK